MGKKSYYPEWFRLASNPVCPTCNRQFDYWADREERSFHIGLISCDIHKGCGSPLPRNLPFFSKISVEVCEVEGCDSARLMGDQKWHPRGKSVILQSKYRINEVHRKVCTKHTKKR
ncbi:MAG: hypothetical protein UU72_C0012G0020 [candidate division WWE3 bacterium GW2011_GWB1_41_6]|uniref:Uncharacterized protein n=1 Tax=candidate division WWE3 bacterium GW2011_GWB1_41_6 TaxID=1619112 RepID=A0A0G0Z436_UNCKA|nr:MAG: hypothetical protein UU72_C0012G0020 [candidate division WWE3 bacterium GW2011_GWB1_41_6]